MQKGKSSTPKRKNARTRQSCIRTHTTKHCTHELHSRTQSQTRGLAGWPTPKPETQTWWLTFLRDSGNETTSITPCPGHHVSTISRLFSWAWVAQGPSWSPLLNEWLKHATLDNTRSQVHIPSSSPTHLNTQKQRKPASDPARDRQFPPPCIGQQIASIWGRQSFFPAPCYYYLNGMVRLGKYCRENSHQHEWTIFV